MIITLLSLIVFVLWSVVVRQELNTLRRERVQAERTWHGDLYRMARNRRVLILFSVWAISLALFLASIQYVDVMLLELSRWAGNGGRVTLLIMAIVILRIRR